MKLSSRLVSALTTLMLVPALLIGGSTQPAHAEGWQPKGGGVFNDPLGDHAAKWRIVNHVDAAVANARKGSRIYISTYLMDARDSVDHLLRAHKRGVQVQMVLDGVYANNGQSQRLAKAFNKDNRAKRKGTFKDGTLRRWGKDRSFVKYCQASCRGRIANNHSKFYVFTHTGTSKNVVMVSSSNLNRGGAEKGWNDLVTIKGRPKLVARFAQVHVEMSRDRPVPGESLRAWRVGPYFVRFFPKRSSGDPVIADLNKVKCYGATGGAGRNGRTVINVAMFAWYNQRGFNIARKLVQLADRGCYLSMVYGAPGPELRKFLTDATKRNPRIKLWDSRLNLDLDEEYEIRAHNKFYLVQGHYGKDKSAYRVHTGTANWAEGTLHAGDENTINISNHGVWRQYMDNWDHIVKKGSRRVGTRIPAAQQIGSRKFPRLSPDMVVGRRAVPQGESSQPDESTSQD